MNNKSNNVIKLQIIAGKATPSSSIGPALGQRGINIMDFCKKFNEETKNHEALPITVVLTIYSNKSYSFKLKKPPTSILIKKLLGLKLTKKPGAGSKTPGKNTIGKISIAQLKSIVKIKEDDLNSYDIHKAIKIIAGSAKSMGIEVEKL